LGVLAPEKTETPYGGFGKEEDALPGRLDEIISCIIKWTSIPLYPLLKTFFIVIWDWQG
jgi:hypothetical protein